MWCQVHVSTITLQLEHVGEVWLGYVGMFPSVGTSPLDDDFLHSKMRKQKSLKWQEDVERA